MLMLMNPEKLKLPAIVLFCVLFMMPLISTVLISAQSDVEGKSYNSVQFAILAILDFPFIILALAGIIASSILSKRGRKKSANWLLIISILASVLGSVLILLPALP